MSQHRRLRQLLKGLSQHKEPKEIILVLIEEALEKHIRMEERALFPQIQQLVGDKRLMERKIGSIRLIKRLKMIGTILFGYGRKVNRLPVI